MSQNTPKLPAVPPPPPPRPRRCGGKTGGGGSEPSFGYRVLGDFIYAPVIKFATAHFSFSSLEIDPLIFCRNRSFEIMAIL